MTGEPIHTEEYNGYTINIYHTPESGMNPREWDNLTTMAFYHRRYNMGDCTSGLPRTEDYGSWDELEAAFYSELDIAILRRVYMYDHGGIDLSLDSPGLWQHYRWDGGCLGFIFVTKDDIRENWGRKRVTKGLLEHANRILEGEFKEYLAYLHGSVYRYEVLAPDGSEWDRANGFITDDPTGDLLAEARGVVDRIPALELAAMEW